MYGGVSHFPLIRGVSKMALNGLKQTLATFLAPTGAQEVTMSVRSSVRSVQTCLELSIFIFLTQIFKLTLCELQAVS